MKNKRLLLTIAALASLFVACGGGNESIDTALTVQSNDKELKKIVRLMDDECPASIGSGMSMEKVEYINGTVSMYYDVPDGIIDVDALRANDDALRSNMLLTYANNEEEGFRRMIDAIIKADADLKLVFNTPSGSYKLRFSASELAENRPGSSSNPEKSLQAMVDNTKLSLPMEVADGMVMTDMNIEGGYVVYSYELDEDLYNISMFRANNRSELKASLIEELQEQSSEGGIMASMIKLLKKCHKGVAYRYVGSDSGDSYTIYVEHNEL